MTGPGNSPSGRWLEPPLPGGARPGSRQPDAASRSPDIERIYRRAVISDLDFLEFGDPSEFLRRQGISAGRTPLVDVWVMPVVSQLALGGPERRVIQGASAAEFPLERVLYEAGEQVQVLLAGPGHGKSTVCRFLACRLAHGTIQGGGLPIYVPVRRLNFAGPGDIETALINAALDDLDNITVGLRDQCASWLREQLATTHVIIDGYDEAPSLLPDSRERLNRNAMKEAVVELRIKYPDARILVTCRERDYADDPSTVIDFGFHYTVRGFGQPQITDAISRWHAAAAKQALAARAPLPDWPERQAKLLRLVADDAAVGELVETPLLLTMMQVVFSPDDEFPRTVSHLATQAIDFLLVSNPRRTAGADLPGDRPYDDAETDLMMNALRTTAFRLTDQIQRGGESSFTRGNLYDGFDAALGGDPQTRVPTDVIVRLVNYLTRGHGVLQDVEARQFEFTHNVFREVLAGQALEPLPLPDIRKLAIKVGWQLPLRYWAGWKSTQPSAGGYACTVAREIVEYAKMLNTPEATAAFLASGEMVVELSSAGAVTRDWAAVAGLKRDLCIEFVRLISMQDIPISLRIRMGDILGVLGDPRLDIPYEDITPASIPRRFVQVPGGSAVFGRHTPHASAREKFLRVPAFPRVQGILEPFSCGKYAVTNSDYHAFMANDPYDDESLWPSDDAKLWAAKDPEFVARLNDQVEHAALYHYQTELLTGRLTREDLAERALRLIERRQPLFWSDPRFNRPNQPVVGVNFWEAQAYCRWLQRTLRSRLGDSIRLFVPSEFEWEYAARRDTADPYPWGTLLNTSVPDAHIRDTEIARIGRSCAVGLFPWSSRDGGSLDMVGNVWEWTSSLPVSYEPGCVSAAPSEDGFTDRIVRGISWLSAEPEAAEVTFRSFDPPFNAYEDLGFRVFVRGDGFE